MNLPAIEFSIKKASVLDLLSNLRACDKDFVPPLSERVNLEEYSNKLYENAITFEAWIFDRLIGMVAAYFNNLKSATGFITNVCVEAKYKGHNIASNLMLKCINYSKENHFKDIILEVNENNQAAINLYKKFNFKIIDNKGEDIKMCLEINNDVKELIFERNK